MDWPNQHHVVARRDPPLPNGFVPPPECCGSSTNSTEPASPPASSITPKPSEPAITFARRAHIGLDDVAAGAVPGIAQRLCGPPPWWTPSVACVSTSSKSHSLG